MAVKVLAGLELRRYNPHMAAQVGVPELTEIRETFGLNKSDLAEVLQCSRSSITKWELRGIPRDRRASVERLVDLARIFRARLISSRIPKIVRTPDTWLGGRTMLQTLGQEGVDPVYAYLARFFTYNGS
ncbi:MAG: hypothetical protein JWM87_119 [Candidatus Eremiobacteraeota bacterium]|nr:hypothetical protein [Candidatus Eremiobacteraeota bacterium]